MNNDPIPMDYEVIVSNEEPDVYVKLSGFRNIEEAEQYADFLLEYLPLLLFESDVLH